MSPIIATNNVALQFAYFLLQYLGGIATVMRFVAIFGNFYLLQFNYIVIIAIFVATAWSILQWFY
jgi:hypothetical protein